MKVVTATPPPAGGEVVTFTVTAPCGLRGVVTLSAVVALTVMCVPGDVPKDTVVTSFAPLAFVSKWCPWMVTLVPPVVTPDVGAMVVMEGAGVL